jgi:DNA-binding MarR family transcriptional regulator
MSKAKLITENPELLHYLDGKLQVTILGGIRLTGLDRLKVTLKLTVTGKSANAFRHNLDLYNSIQTEQLTEKAAEALDISTSELSQVLNRLTTALENYRAERLEAMKPKQAEKKELTEAERKAAISFLKSPNLLNRTKAAIAQSGLIGEEINSLIAYLTYTSRKRHTPLHLMCLGASGTGKTWLQEKVSELMPEEDKLEITTLSSNAFYYFGREELKHKLLLIEDLDGAESVLYPLRELQSKRKISKTVTLKDNKGNLKTVTLNVEGPVCVSGCTTREQLYEDNANRCILLYMDNSSEQDKQIMDYQRKLSAGLIDQHEERKIREQVKNVQRILKPITVKNPYATYLQLPEAVFKPRRTMLLLLLFTETITYYHQYQRELKTDTDTGEQYIESTIEDIEAAFTLLETTILKKSDELNDACRNFFERLKMYLKARDTEAFYAKEIRSAFRLSPSSLKRYLYELERMGHIKITRGSRYKGFEYKVSSWNDLETLQGNTHALITEVLAQVKQASVARSSGVVHTINGPLNKQRINKKEAVAHES